MITRYPEAKLFSDIDISGHPSDFRKYTWWNDVAQGELGDCYFIAAISSVGKYPDLIKQAFVTKDKNTAGVYIIRFYIRGKPWFVSVSDDMVYNTKNEQLEFGRIDTNHAAYWGPLLEKAWSKVDFNYSNAQDGLDF